MTESCSRAPLLVTHALTFRILTIAPQGVRNDGHECVKSFGLCNESFLRQLSRAYRDEEIQMPRVFYRREPDAKPFVVGKS